MVKIPQFASSGSKVAPSSGITVSGFKPLQKLPAEYLNFELNALSQTNGELATILESVGVTPVSGTLDQVAQSLVLKVPTVSGLRNLPVPEIDIAIQCEGYWTPGDGGGGPVRRSAYGAPPGTYVNNGGSVLVEDGGDGSSAWVFQTSSSENSKTFGIFPGSSANFNTAALNANTALCAFEFDSGTYQFDGSVTLTRGIFSRNGAVLAFSDIVGTAVTDNSPDGITGVTFDFDGSDYVENGYRFNVDNTPDNGKAIDISVFNTRNLDDTKSCRAIFVVQGAGATVKRRTIDIKAYVDGVTSTANGIVGDAAGSARCIQLQMGTADVFHTVNIHDSVAINCTCGAVHPAEDADNIHIADFADSGTNYIIEKCLVSRGAKRQIKIQADNVVVRDCLIIPHDVGGESGLYGVAPYGKNIKIENNTFSDMRGDDDFVEFINSDTQTEGLIVHGNTFRSNSRFKCLRLEDASFVWSDNVVESTTPTGAVANAMIYLQGQCKAVISDSIFSDSANIFSVLAADSTTEGSIQISNVKATGFLKGLYVTNNADLSINVSQFECDARNDFTNVSGTFELLISNSNIKVASDRAIQVTGTPAKIKIDGCELAGTVAVVDASIPYVNVINCEIESYDTTYGVACKSYSVLMNNRYEACSYGNVFTFSSKVKSAGNLFVNCTNTELTTSSTNTITYNNNAIAIP